MVEAAEEPADTAAAPAPAEQAPAPVAAPVAAASVEDLPVDHATAASALLALRVGVRVDQLGTDSIDDLVDGVSSRRNQVLMDIGKEFDVPAIDGAHEAALPELIETLAARSAHYRYPGPILSDAVDGALTAALGPVGSSPAALAKRVAGHWGLGSGWTARAGLTLALGTREGSSRRGGDLATVSGASADALIDAAVSAAAADAGVAVAPASAASAGGGAVDAAAVTELREHVEGILVDHASDLLARLGRLPAAAEEEAADIREALATLALLESEHGSARLVAPAFDARRHVLLDSAATWARADIDHLVQASLAAEAGQAPLDESALEALVDQIAVHRDADPRIVATLTHHRDRLAAAGRTATVALLDRALTAQPTGVAVPGLDRLRSALADPTAAQAVAARRGTGRSPGPVRRPGRAGHRRLAELDRVGLGGPPAARRRHRRVATTTDTPERIAAYRDLERRYAGVGAQLHVVPANLASFADVDGLLDWLTTPTDRGGRPDHPRGQARPVADAGAAVRGRPGRRRAARHPRGRPARPCACCCSACSAWSVGLAERSRRRRPAPRSASCCRCRPTTAPSVATAPTATRRRRSRRWPTSGISERLPLGRAHPDHLRGRSAGCAAPA